MRILVFSTLYPNAAMPSHGVFVENRLRAFLQRHDADIRVIAPVPWFPFTHSIFGKYASFAKAPDREFRHGIEIQHPHYFVLPKLAMGMAPSALRACLRKELNTLLSEGWKPDLIDAHYLYPDGIAAVSIATEHNIPVVMTARGTDVNLIPKFDGPRTQIVKATQQADAVITVAKALKTALVDIGAPSDKITTLRNGVDLGLFKPEDREKARASLGVSGTVLASVGQLIERKGNHLILDALPGLKGVTLLLVGDGEERAALEKQADALGISNRVKFLGLVCHEDLPAIYNAADALVLASSREGWPNVLLEAMACGTPCVATNVWGNAEVISSRDAGRLCEARTSSAISDTIRVLLENPPSRDDVRAHAELHSWDKTADAMSVIFDQVRKITTK